MTCGCVALYYNLLVPLLLMIWIMRQASGSYQLPRPACTSHTASIAHTHFHPGRLALPTLPAPFRPVTPSALLIPCE